MSVSDFDLFALVVQNRSLSAAGRELGLSPAMVSKRLKRLEDRLGVRLLNRTTRQISLTELGVGFYERVRSALGAIQDAEMYASGNSLVPQGLLRVSAPTTFTRLHIAPHLDTFLKRNGDIQIQLDVTDTYANIVQQGFDVAIRVGALRDSSLIARKLSASRAVLCAAPTYLGKHGAPDNLDALAAHRLLCTEQQSSWRVQSLDGVEAVKVSSVLATNSNEVVLAAALSGVGIALRPLWEVSEALRCGVLQRVLTRHEGAADVNVYAVYPSRRFIPAKLGMFLGFMADLYGTRPSWDIGFERQPDLKLTDAIAGELTG